jgi:signal recognition particle GTPase
MVIPVVELLHKSVVNKPIKFVGTGEKMEAIDVFYPVRMERILEWEMLSW